MNKVIDIVIVGAGPSGIYAATYAALKNLKTIVIEASSSSGGQPKQVYAHKKIYDFPGHNEITGNEMVSNLLEQQKPLKDKIEYFLNTKIISWKRLKNQIISLKLSNKKVINTKTIIIATGNGGFGPNELDPKLINKKTDLSKIHYYVQPLSTYKNKNIIFLGGGDSAVEWAGQIAKTKMCKKVSIVHHKSQYRANAYYVKAMHKNKVEEYLDYQICEINPNKIIIKNKQTNKLLNLGYDYLIVQYGFKLLTNRQTEWTDLKKNGNIFLVNRSQETSESNIYAIGLAANYPERANLMITGMAEAVNAVKAINHKINPYVTGDYIIKEKD